MMVILEIALSLFIFIGLSTSFYYLYKQRKQKKQYAKAFPVGVKAILDNDLENNRKKLHLKQLGISAEAPEESTPSNYRHNIHCPRCGRFSKAVPGYELAVECYRHGVQVRWKDSIADWARTGSIEVIDTVPDYYVAPVTEAIPIITTAIELDESLAKSRYT